jgi:hypothetical protein
MSEISSSTSSSSSSLSTRFLEQDLSKFRHFVSSLEPFQARLRKGYILRIDYMIESGRDYEYFCFVILEHGSCVRKEIKRQRLLTFIKVLDKFFKDELKNFAGTYLTA